MVAGASEGLGAAFAEQLAGRGMNVLLLARREKLLAELAERLTAEYGIDARWRVLGLSDPDPAARLEAACGDISPGLLVYNAALIPTGPFVEMTQDTLERIASVNVPGMLTPDTVARTTLDALGKGPRVIPGMVNRVVWQIMTRLLPRKPLIRAAGRTMTKVV